MTADTYDYEQSAKRHPTRQAQLRDTYDHGYGYEYECNDGYNIDTSIQHMKIDNFIAIFIANDCKRS